MTQMTLERSRVITAPVAVVWAIISDLDAYHRHTESLSKTTVLSGAGQGARRRCIDSSGADWEETCTLWIPKEQYVITVDVSTYPAKYRAIFRAFTGTWSVEPVDGGTRVSIRFDAELRRVPGLSALAGRLAERSGSDLHAILESYAQDVDDSTRLSQPGSG